MKVRNPLAAAMSASSFVNASLQEDEPFRNHGSLKACRNDVHIVQSSLKFINDLLRSMLDMQKAASDRLVLELKPVDVYSDVLEPIRTILDSKHNPFEFVIDCPPNLALITDSLRLKQVVMNLASNSRKFVTQGFIKVGAAVIDGHVQLFVEDSGPGVPLVKRKRLFAKYQESLDSLSQGTGIGLCLSKSLLELLGGELYLDETFDSGIAGFPGTRFVISTKKEPVEVDTHIPAEDTEQMTDSGHSMASSMVKFEPERELPSDLDVLIVDDDMILRRLITRSLQRIAPTWKLAQAANGETALKMTAEKHFDVVFQDQYMASVEKQLLGTETVHAMRAQGATSCICGLSANEIEESFLQAGANAFMRKPFPCEKQALTEAVHRVLQTCPSLYERAATTDIRPDNDDVDDYFEAMTAGAPVNEHKTGMQTESLDNVV